MFPAREDQGGSGKVHPRAKEVDRTAKNCRVLGASQKNLLPRK